MGRNLASKTSVATLDGFKHPPDICVERWRGWAIAIACVTVAKWRHRLKFQTKISSHDRPSRRPTESWTPSRYRNHHNFGYFLATCLPWYLMDFCTSPVVRMSARNSLWGVSLDLSSFLELWGWRNKEIRSITSSNGDEKRWNVFDSTEVYNKDKKYAYWRWVRCMELSACVCESGCKRFLSFFSTTPRQCNLLHGQVNLPQTVGEKALEPLVWTHIGRLYYASEVWVDFWAQPWRVQSFYGWFSLSGYIRIVHMWIDGDHGDPITAAVHHRHFHMIVGGSLMQNFAGFVQHLVLS